MSKETMKKTIDTIQSADSMKAVKVAFELSESIQDSVTKVMKVVHGNVNNINLLAQRINDLEIKIRNLSDEQRKN
jgi:TolA-binding protein